MERWQCPIYNGPLKLKSAQKCEKNVVFRTRKLFNQVFLRNAQLTLAVGSPTWVKRLRVKRPRVKRHRVKRPRVKRQTVKNATKGKTTYGQKVRQTS